MKKLFLLFLIVFGVNQLYAQVLKGTVYDGASGKPLAIANVYLDGTSYSTKTDSYGRFVLNVDKQINTNLIVSHVAFNQVVIDKPFEKDLGRIHLYARTNVLSEVSISPSKFTREQMLKAFREQFLGRTRAGRSCKILNEEDIDLHYKASTRTLTASSEEPLIIENEFLGYKISFGLVDFFAQFNDKTLEHESLYASFLLGSSMFVDIEPNDKKIISRRDQVYKLSPIYFFKNFASGTLKDVGYRMFNKGFQINPSDYFAVKDTLSMKIISIKPNTGIDNQVRIGEKGPIKARVAVLLNKTHRTDLIFNTDRLFLDRFGNINASDVFYSGYFGQQRVGNMLPLDYELTE